MRIQVPEPPYEFDAKRQTLVSPWYNKGGKAVLRIQAPEPLSKFDVKHQTPISYGKTRIAQGFLAKFNEGRAELVVK